MSAPHTPNVTVTRDPSEDFGFTIHLRMPKDDTRFVSTCEALAVFLREILTPEERTEFSRQLQQHLEQIEQERRRKIDSDLNAIAREAGR